MLRRDPFGAEARRGHRHVGLRPAPERERHWVIAGVVVTAVVGAVSAYTAYDQAQTQSKISKYNQKVAKNAAQAQRDAARVEAQNKADEYRQIMGAQRAGIGASGVLGSEGTPLVVQMDSAEQAALNEARIRYSGEVGAQKQEEEAIIQGYMGKQAVKRGYIEAGSSLLGSAGTAATTYGKYGKKT